MKRALAILVFGVLFPAAGFAGSLDIHGGAFFPSANSNLFSDDKTLYTVTNSDFTGFTGGIQFNQRLARNLEIGFGVDGYEKSNHTSYRSFTFPDGSDIRQTLRFEEVPVSVTLRLIPTNRRARVAPFIGVGADLIFWRYEEFGDFIDFSTPGLPTATDSFRSDGVHPGVHVEGGVRIPLNYDVSLVVAGKYLWSTTDMGGDFAGNRIDLGGASATIGINFHF